jgi:hypothetical protein
MEWARSRSCRRSVADLTSRDEYSTFSEASSCAAAPSRGGRGSFVRSMDCRVHRRIRKDQQAASHFLAGPLLNKGEPSSKTGQKGQTHGQNPPSGLQLPQHDARLLRLDGVDGAAAGKATAELDHALGEADLAQALVALLVGDAVGRAGATAAAGSATTAGALVRHGGVVHDLVVDGVVGGAQRRVEDGQEAELGGHHNRGWRRGMLGGRQRQRRRRRLRGGGGLGHQDGGRRRWCCWCWFCWW